MMMPNRKRPSILRILNADFFAGITLAAPIFVWVGYFILNIIAKLPWLPWACAAASLVFIGLSAYRCWTILTIFERGTEVDAHVTQVWFGKERGRLGLDFTYEGQKIHANCAVMKSDKSVKLKQGQTVRLVFDPQKPQEAFVRDLFVK
jgi:hypothetical protein